MSRIFIRLQDTLLTELAPLLAVFFTSFYWMNLVKCWVSRLQLRPALMSVPPFQDQALSRETDPQLKLIKQSIESANEWSQAGVENDKDKVIRVFSKSRTPTPQKNRKKTYSKQKITIHKSRRISLILHTYGGQQKQRHLPESLAELRHRP